MQAATKASTVGVLGVMCGVAVAHTDASVTIRAVLIAGFLLLTSPVAAHAIARSALGRAVPVAPGTRVARGDRLRAGGLAPVDGDGLLRLGRAREADGRSAPRDGGADEVRR
jgi:hypothetical protein